MNTQSARGQFGNGLTNAPAVNGGFRLLCARSLVLGRMRFGKPIACSYPGISDDLVPPAAVGSRVAGRESKDVFPQFDKFSCAYVVMRWMLKEVRA